MKKANFQRLKLKVFTVSLETVKIVDNLWDVGLV